MTPSDLRTLFQRQVEQFLASPELQAVEAGRAPRPAMDELICRIYQAHARSPKLLGFLFALAPPGRPSEDTKHNLLEELGEDGGESHPELLRQVLVAAELGHRAEELLAKADADLRRYIVDPLLYGTLRDVGFAALAEVVAFELMLSQVASRLGRALRVHRGLPEASLRWFHHHSEVDVAHAEQGLSTLVAYARWYDLPAEDAEAILEMTFRENVFLRRYFGRTGAER